MNKKQQQPLSSPSRNSAGTRRWQLAVAVVAFTAAALSGCDRRAETTGSASMPASAASR